MLIQLLDWIAAHGKVAFFIGVFIIIAIEEIGRAIAGIIRREK